MGTSIKKPYAVLLLLLSTGVIILLTIFKANFNKWLDVTASRSTIMTSQWMKADYQQVTLYNETTADSSGSVLIMNGSLFSPELNTVSILNQYQDSASTNLNESLAKDMYKCSLAMGVSPGVLEAKRDKINLIASRASHLLNVFWEIVPKNYLPRLKNPCWYPSNRTSQKLYCLPYFLLPGVPKSGTTTLHHVLSQHPQIVAPTGPIAGGKEPQWWHKIPLDMSRDGLKDYTVHYLKNFRTIADRINSTDGEGIVTYDASQTMLIDVQDYSFSIDNEDYCAMAAMISRVLPTTKIVIIMREPVARAYSQFLYLHGSSSKWSKEMKKNTSLYFHNHIQAAVKDFDKCLTQNRSIYECTNEVRTDRQALHLWLGTGIYYIYLLKWMQFWPRENFLFLKTESMAENPFSILNDITRFLSLDPVSKETALKWFSKKINAQHNLPKTQDSEMLSTTKQILERFYAPYNERLERLIGITWTYQNSSSLFT